MSYLLQLGAFLLQLLAYFCLGWLVVGKTLKTENRLSFFVLLTIIGSAVSLAFSLTFAWLNVRWLLPIVWVISGLLVWRSRKHLRIPPNTLIIDLFCVIGGILFALPLLTSGWINQTDMLFWFVNHTDSMINIALIQELIHRFPLDHPGFADIPLKGYHVLYNLLIADFSRLFQADTMRAYLHWFPLWLGISLTTTLFYLGTSITKRNTTGFWTMVFGLFGGSLVFIYNRFFPTHLLSVDDGFGITNPGSLIGSPAFVFALVMLLVGMLIIKKLQEHQSTRLLMIGSLLFGLLLSVKVYLGIIGLPIWLIACLYFFWKTKNKLALVAGLASVAITAVVFLPMNGSYGHLIYQKFWPVYRLFEGNFHWTTWMLRIQTYRANNNWFGVLRMELIGLLFFLVGNLGTRLISIGVILQPKLRRELLIHLIGVMILIILFLGLFYIQPIGTYNMIQLFWAGLVFSGIVAGIVFDTFLKNLKPLFHYGVIIVVLALTLPSYISKITTMHTIDPYRLPLTQLHFYQTVNNQGTYDDTILFLPDRNRYKRSMDWIYTDRVLPLALSNKQFYISPEIIQFRYEELFPERLQYIDVLLQDQPETFIPTLNKMQTEATKIRYIITEGEYQSVEKLPNVRLVTETEELKLYQLP